MAGRNATAALAAALGAPQLSYQLISAADIQPEPTPWGPAAAVLLCLLPILLLLATTLLPPLALPSSTSLPLAATLLALIRLAYLSSPPLLVLGHSVVGALEGLVPLAVIFGAVLLFEAMAATGCLQWLMASVRCLCAGSPIAEVFLIGWAFAYTVSGVGGFSTPMALATPMLVSLGHDPLSSLVAVVCLNGLAAHLGSVGMAVWFGFRSLGLPPTAILHIGLKSAAVVGACSFVLAPAAAAALVPWRDLACNAGFVLLSVGSAVLPTVLFALFSPEFPLVAGGLISLLVTWLLIKYGIGLRPPCTHHTPADVETAVQPAAARARAKDPVSASAATGGMSIIVAAGSHPSTPSSPVSSPGAGSKPPTPAAAATAAADAAVPAPEDGLDLARQSSTTDSNSGRLRTDRVARQDNRLAALVSPFEIYRGPPLPEAFLCDDSPFAEAHELVQSATGVSDSSRCVSPVDILDRRSRSLIAAAAAVGALMSRPTTAEGAGADTSVCIFRCPSCAADQRELLAAEAAAMQRQLSAHDTGVLAAAAAAAAAVDQERPMTASQPHRHTHSQAKLLPALSVVNHATGQHIVISGFDKLTGALKFFWHQGQALTASSPFNTWLAAFNNNSHNKHKGSSPDLSQGVTGGWWGAAGPEGGGLLLLLPEVVFRTLPIWLTVLLLLVTHVPALRLQDLLRSTSPSFTLHLGTLGSFSASPALVLTLRHIFTQPSADWTAELLYMPCLIPFVVVSCVTLGLYRGEVRGAGVHWWQPFVTAWGKVAGTVWAMVGALVLAQLMCAGGRGSPAFIIAYYLTAWMGKGYLAIAGFLGALGSFVSGSVMGSNMTQGAIQAVAADRLGVPVTGLLAVQVAGACAGKMVCISSILSAKVVLTELHDVSESQVIRRTAPLALLFVILAQALGLIWTLGGVWPDA